MNERLKDLIDQASSRVEAENAERESDLRSIQQKEKEQEASEFKRYVEAALGQDVLAEIGPVSFSKNSLRQSMTFEQDSRAFRLQQESGALVQLQETENQQFSYRLLGSQFNLTNSNSRNFFLHTLGTALKKAR